MFSYFLSHLHKHTLITDTLKFFPRRPRWNGKCSLRVDISPVTIFTTLCLVRRSAPLHSILSFSILYETRRVLVLAKRAGSSIGGQLNRFQFRLKQAQTAARQMKRNIPKVLCNRRFIYSRYLIRLDDTTITAHKPTLSAIKIDPVTPVCTGQTEMSGD